MRPAGPGSRAAEGPTSFHHASSSPSLQAGGPSGSLLACHSAPFWVASLMLVASAASWTQSMPSSPLLVSPSRLSPLPGSYAQPCLSLAQGLSWASSCLQRDGSCFKLGSIQAPPHTPARSFAFAQGHTLSPQCHLSFVYRTNSYFSFKTSPKNTLQGEASLNSLCILEFALMGPSAWKAMLRDTDLGHPAPPLARTQTTPS